MRRRKVGNLMALAVLATLLPRPMHPYELASVLRARGKDQDMQIKWGSLYTVVANLEKHGYLAAVGSSRQGGRPERTIYQVTEAGRAELEDWVAELLATPVRERPRFKAALSVLPVLAPGPATTLLRQRVQRLTARVAESRDALAGLRRELPRLVLIEAEYELAMTEAELEWTRALVAELDAGSFPGLADWKAWHDTGELPAEIAALAEEEAAGG